MNAYMSRDSFSSSSRIGRVGKNGVVVGTACAPSHQHPPLASSRGGLTFVGPTRDVDDERELALKIGRVEMGEADEDFVAVDSLDRALEPVFACDELRLGAGGVRAKDRLFAFPFCMR